MNDTDIHGTFGGAANLSEMVFNVARGHAYLRLPGNATREDVAEIEEAVLLQLNTWKRAMLDRAARWPFPEPR